MDASEPKPLSLCWSDIVLLMLGPAGSIGLFDAEKPSSVFGGVQHERLGGVATPGQGCYQAAVAPKMILCSLTDL